MGVLSFRPQPTYGGIPMSLKLNPVTSITFLDSDFVHLINHILQESIVDLSGGVILCFHKAEQSKSHPLEISIDRRGNLKYFIVLANSGIPPVAELVWNFTENRFSQFGGGGNDLETGRAQLHLWCRNLASLSNSGAYEVTVTPQFDPSLGKSIQST
jgi:hypothetical protein